MAIVYCDWATGDDTTGDGSASLPYKTITKASTGLTGGDEVRVAKSPEPTALTGTISFTNNSVNITGTNTLFTTELAIGDFILGGDDNWWEVVTITSDTAATLYRVYSGATESGVSSQKLGVTDTGEAAATDTKIQQISSSGTSSAYLKISGGWDLSSEEQNGQTYFRQIHSTFANRYGYGLYTNGKANLEFSRLHFLRYYIGFWGYIGNTLLVKAMECISCGNNNFYLQGPCNSIFDSIKSLACPKDGISVSVSTIFISPTIEANGWSGISLSASCPEVKILGTVTKHSTEPLIKISTIGAKVFVNKAGAVNASQAGSLADFANARLSIADINGQSYIYTDGGNIVSQNATAGGTGKEWKFSVTSSNRGANYHLDQEIARVLVAANKQVSVKLYFKKSNASAIKGGLFMRGKQIAGVDDDILVECPADTNRNQVTLQFTPTEAGVVSIEAHAWYVSSTTDYVIVDDINITQAD